MKSLPMGFKILFIIISLTAAIILGITLNTSEWAVNDLPMILIFSALVISSESMPVSLPKGGYVTVSYAIFFCMVILFPPRISLTVGAAAGLLIFGRAAEGQPLFKRIFNGSLYIILLKTSSSLIGSFGITLNHLTPASVVLFFLTAMVYMIVNMTVVAIALSFLQNRPTWEIWISNMRWSFLNFAALAPLGFLMAMIFKGTGALGLALFVIPLLLSRHSFQRYMDMRESYLNTIKALVHAIEAKDKYTRGHSERVAQYSVAIAEKLQLPQDKVEYIQYAAVLHDVGKIGVSESILNKKERLLDNEWNTIRNHPVIGQQLVKDIKFLYDIDLGVRHHHERYDGKGYPDGLKGEEIPLEARIIAVADCFDAMTSDRTYRGSRTINDALKELRRAAGTQFDPQLVEVFCQVYPGLNVDESKFLFGAMIEESV